MFLDRPVIDESGLKRARDTVTGRAGRIPHPKGVVMLDVLADQASRPYLPSVEDVRIAIRVIAVHWPEPWPHGVLCANDHLSYPCDARRWADQIVEASGTNDTEALAAATAYRAR